MVVIVVENYIVYIIAESSEFLLQKTKQTTFENHKFSLP